MKHKLADTIRLDSHLAHLGYASRRKIEEFLKKHTVAVNNIKTKEAGTRIHPSKDIITINGKPIHQPRLEYYMLHKPKGVISTASDDLKRKTVTSMVDSDERLFPVGRLDRQSSGLILLTNDGELANQLTHPSFHMPKIYEVVIDGGISQTHLNRLRKGVQLTDGMTAPTEVEIKKHIGNQTVLTITLYEGKNRQIRRMCGALGLNLLELKRIAIGPIELGSLRPGKSRPLKSEEVNALHHKT
jgi:pseudouridine synthase